MATVCYFEMRLCRNSTLCRSKHATKAGAFLRRIADTSDSPVYDRRNGSVVYNLTSEINHKCILDISFNRPRVIFSRLHRRRSPFKLSRCGQVGRVFFFFFLSTNPFIFRSASQKLGPVVARPTTCTKLEYVRKVPPLS